MCCLRCAVPNACAAAVVGSVLLLCAESSAKPPACAALAQSYLRLAVFHNAIAAAAPGAFPKYPALQPKAAEDSQ
ncbi:hypothetical protein GUJ93_ZPchr0001g29435 [Zizania palustris]|uniref:Uncharacterized protein n=1 Tax=Zizania palustris TaxID=103762 RepID=A0A8J5V7B8_ZIZPA|nr:hypothetical protein GUJ93_ZPchr0001g29435 [Zizania palustris]